MTTTAELLKTHNELAEKQGKMKLKAWKGPRHKLQERVDLMIKNKKVSPKELADKLIEKEQKRKDEADGMLTIVQIAEQLNMDPKVARAKLRRKGKNANEGRWPAIKKDSKEHEEIVKLLTTR